MHRARTILQDWATVLSTRRELLHILNEGVILAQFPKLDFLQCVTAEKEHVAALEKNHFGKRCRLHVAGSDKL
jgi:hypothetical protein